MKRQAASWLLSFSVLFLAQTVSAKEWKDIYDEMALALLWHQSSDESKALSWQTYNMARDIVDQQLKQPSPSGKKPTIISDIDGTLVDSSSYFAGFLGTNEAMNPERSNLWWQQQPAIPKPGALAFLNYAVKNNVEVFYLTARVPEPQVEKDTFNFLQRVGAPQADPQHIKISNGHKKFDIIPEIVGDDRELLLAIGDKFSDLGLERSEQTTVQLEWLETNSHVPGQKTLMQANPVGGTWECLSHNKCKHSPDEEFSQRRQHIQKLVGNYTPPEELTNGESLFEENQIGQSIKWVTESAGYPFITRQIFNRASLPWKEHKNGKGDAIIIDIDGTLIDLTPWPAVIMLAKAGHKTLNLFHHWTHSNQPIKAVPGAQEYIEQVQSSGGEVFYVTNRMTHDEHGKDMHPPLFKALKSAGLPIPDSKHLVMRGEFCKMEDCSKKVRFEAIRSGKVTGYPIHVAQILGDTLEDIELTSTDMAISASAEPDGVIAELGRSRFLLPFPIYTRGWLFRLYQQWYGDDWSKVDAATLNADRKKKLQRWTPDISMLE